MTSKPVDLPADLASAYLALLSEREMLQAERDVVVAERDTVVAERDIAVAQAANAQAMLSDSEALIAKLELAIEKLRRELRGKRSERTARPDGIAARRAGDGRDRGRGCSAGGCRQDRKRTFVHTQAAGPKAVAGGYRARARGDRPPSHLCMLRRIAPVETGRGRH